MTSGSRKRGRGKTLWRFCAVCSGISHTRKEKDGGDATAAEPNARFDRGVLGKHRSSCNSRANRALLEQLASSLAVSIDTVTRQQLEIKQLTELINALKNKGTSVTNGVTGTGEKKIPTCKHFKAVGRTALHRNNRCYFDLQNNKYRKVWEKQLMEEK